MTVQREFWRHLAGACVLAIVATVPILANPMMDRGFEIARLSVAEPLAALAFAAILLAGVVKDRAVRWAPGRLAAFLFIAFLLLAGLSTCFSETPLTSLFGSYYRREGLLAWCTYAAFFFALAGWASNHSRTNGFIDVLLLTSLIPCAYAIQQRLNLDFSVIAEVDLTRPHSTLGNPVFLAAYLGLLLPVTATRVWHNRRQLLELSVWLSVLLMQGYGLLITQTRGPLLALVVGTLMLCCFAAARSHSRRFFVSAAGLFTAALLALVALNIIPPVKRLAQEVPVASRLIYALDGDREAATTLASRSAASRLGIWHSGIETFSAATFKQQLIGFGPDSAYLHLFPHIPASLMQTEGYQESKTFDRLHADTLDIGLNFGLIAWLAYCLFFCTVIYTAARALFGLSGTKPLWIFSALTLGSGIFSALAAMLIGLASAAVPAFGLGIGAGWFVFFIALSWRTLRQGFTQTSQFQAGQWGLLAGMTSSLLVFWLDAQVNIPVMTTRLISFAIAALMLKISYAVVDDEKNKNEIASADSFTIIPYWLWGLVLSLLAACASFLPAVNLSAALHGTPETANVCLSVLPTLPLLLLTGLLILARRRNASAGQHLAWPLALALGIPALFGVGLWQLMASIDSAPGWATVQQLSAASMMTPVLILLICLAYAWIEQKNALHETASPRSSTKLLFILAILLSVSLLMTQNWQASQADIASTLAHSSRSNNLPETRVALTEKAIRIMPYERRYRRQLTFDLLAQAAANIHSIKTDPASFASVEQSLLGAEKQARENLRRFPRDPWALMALANVLQFRALHLLRPFDPPTGERAANEARKLFVEAYQIFPSQPLLLRNWAQLEFDEARYQEVSRLLDLMENLIPKEIAPYLERIAMSRQLGDPATVAATLDRASRQLDRQSFAELQAVANQQQR